PGPLSRPRPGRWQQSRRRLHPSRNGAGPGDDRRGAAPPRGRPQLRGPPDMSVIDRSLDSLTFLTDAAREALRRRLRELAGIALLVLALPFAGALGTWSVQGPSLSHSTNPPVRNLLGVPGAILADPFDAAPWPRLAGAGAPARDLGVATYHPSTPPA